MHPQLQLKLELEKKELEAKGLTSQFSTHGRAFTFVAGGEANQETGSASLVFMMRTGLTYYLEDGYGEIVEGSEAIREATLIVIIGIINAKEIDNARVQTLSISLRFAGETQEE